MSPFFYTVQRLKNIHRISLCLILTVVVSLCGCTLPGSFFRPKSIEGQTVAAHFELRPIDLDVVHRLIKSRPTINLPADLVQGQVISFDRLEIDDRLSISVFEPNAGIKNVLGGGKIDLLSDVPIDTLGQIDVPFAGYIKAKGMTVEELREEILLRLRRVVLDPQVQVRLEKRASKLVTVQGLAGKSGRIALDRSTTRLSELLAQVVPDQRNPEMLQILIRRGGTTGRIRLADIYEDNNLNIALKAGDSLVFSEVVHTVNVLGAVNLQGSQRIPKRNFSLLDAIALARGMNEERADPSAVFLFKQTEIEASASEKRLPIIFQINFRKPQDLLLARTIPIADNDIVFIGDASFTDVRKVASTFNAILVGTARVIDLVDH